MDELFSILNFNEIKRQAAKVAALSRSVTEITLHTPDIPLNDSANTYPHYIFVVTLSLTDAKMDSMISKCPSETDFENMLKDDSLNTMEALTGKLNKMEAGYNNAIPSDIDAVLEIAQGFRKSWTTGYAGMKQNIDRFYKPDRRPTVPIFWDMIVLTSDGGYPKDLRTDPEGMIRVFPDEPTLAIESTPAPQKEPQADNYFKQSGEFWTIRFQGKESTPIKAVKGLLYISCLLERPGKSVSCVELDRVANKNTSKTISQTEASNEGLHTGHKLERVNSFEAGQQLTKEQLRLENELRAIDDMDAEDRTPEDELRRKEIEEKLNEFYSLTREKYFTDEKSKKQILVIRNLQTAYAIIDKDRNMVKCVEYLSTHIAPDGAGGYMYNGDIKWDIS